MPSDPSEPCRSADELPDLSGHGNSDRVREDQRVGLQRCDPLGDVQHPGRAHRPLERTAEGDAERHRGAKADARATISAAAWSDSSTEDPLVSLVERLRDAEREAHLVEPGGYESLVAALVERQARIRDAVASIETCDDLLRSRHLRHAARIDEARDLDGGHAGCDDAPNELGSDAVGGRRARSGARRAVHLVDRHASLPLHAVTLSK